MDQSKVTHQTKNFIDLVSCNWFLGRYNRPRFDSGSLAQSVEQLAFNQLVTSSNLVRPTTSKLKLPLF
jgi:hypothetical protein